MKWKIVHVLNGNIVDIEKDIDSNTLAKSKIIKHRNSIKTGLLLERPQG